MRVPLVGWLVDERFLEHRRRSTSGAGIVGGVLALLLFMYRLYIDHVTEWDLLAVGLTFVLVKYALFLWYRIKD